MKGQARRIWGLGKETRIQELPHWVFSNLDIPPKVVRKLQIDLYPPFQLVIFK